MDQDILGPFGIHFWYGWFYLVFSAVLDMAGVALIAGLLYMMYRRKWLALPRLDYTRPDRSPSDPDYDRSGYRREDWAFLWTLITIAFTGYLLEASRVVWLQGDPSVWDYRWFAPVGTATAYLMKALGLGPDGAAERTYAPWADLEELMRANGRRTQDVTIGQVETRVAKSGKKRIRVKVGKRHAARLRKRDVAQARLIVTATDAEGNRRRTVKPVRFT
mgnify:CR=1 FL=1